MGTRSPACFLGIRRFCGVRMAVGCNADVRVCAATVLAIQVADIGLASDLRGLGFGGIRHGCDVARERTHSALA
jgi:hypothetical protein